MGSRIATFLTLGATWVACGRDAAILLGAPVDEARARPVGEVIGTAATAEVIVSGRISAVCESSGCWVVLQDARGEKVYELMTDLAPASLSVPASVRGRPAVASGRLTGTGKDLRLRVTGFVVR